MENLEKNTNTENAFINDQEINAYLLETAKWAKFLAILGYVGIAILIIIGIISLLGLSFLNGLYSGIIPVAAFSAVYFIIAAAYYVPVCYLYQFSTRMKEGIHSNNINSITAGFKNLKSFYKFMGIFAIVILSIYALIFITALIIGFSLNSGACMR